MERTGSAGTNCALRGDGSVWCWGNSWAGQLGNGKQQYDQATPQRVLKVYDPPQALSGIVTMDTNVYGSCAIDADGQTHCWGATKYFGGDLNTNSLYTAAGTILDSNGITPLEGLVSLAQGKFGGCGVMEDETARCWGSNSWGALGNGTDGDGFSPPVVVLAPDGQAPLSGVVGLAASYGHNYKESRCAILDDETEANRAVVHEANGGTFNVVDTETGDTIATFDDRLTAQAYADEWSTVERADESPHLFSR